MKLNNLFFKIFVCLLIYLCLPCQGEIRLWRRGVLDFKIFATETGFSISPPFQEVIINSSDFQKTSGLEITNNTNSSATFNLSAVDFGSLDESGGVAFLGSSSEGERKYGLASWIQIETNQLILAPNSSQKIKISIINKQSLSPGGHYGAVLVTLAPSNEKGNVVGLKQAYASLFFVKKTGGEVYSLKLNKFDFHHNFFQINKTVKLNFNNDGNIHIVPRGTITITDPFNRVVLKGIINPDSSIILPESLRNIFVTLSPVAPVIWPGQYHLLIDHRFDGQPILAYQQINFFFPAKIWLIIVPILGVFFWRKKRQKI